jgi:hypothetical protein
MREPARREPTSRPQVPDFEPPPHQPVRPDDFALRDFPAAPDFVADAPGARDPELEITPARQRPRRRAEPAQPPEDIREGRELRSRGRLYTYLALAVGLALLAGALAWEWQPMIGALRGLTASRTAAPVAQQPTAPGRQKIPDRIGADDSSNTGSQAAAAVAQRVVLYEEDPADPQGKRYVGSAVWHTDVVSRGAGQPADSVVRADIEIPERKMTMKWSLQRNSDKTLPASHTVEVVFTLPPDFPHGGVQNVPGVLMKENEQTRGVPLSGLAVKVTDGYFLIGLSAVDSEMQRNIALLKDRPWFDVPIVYTDGRRAILAVEKGTPGERAFSTAFTAWKQ